MVAHFTFSLTNPIYFQTYLGQHTIFHRPSSEIVAHNPQYIYIDMLQARFYPLNSLIYFFKKLMHGLL